jgi:tetraacyldisaccharide 4'-kinase
VVLTRCDQAEARDLNDLREQIRSLVRGRPLLESRMRAVNAIFPTGPVAAFCAVGNPKSFFEQLRRHGYELALEKAFADHHSYTQKDVDGLIAAATRAGAKSLITTAKDAVKLRSLSFSLPWQVLQIEIEIQNEDALVELITAASR